MQLQEFVTNRTISSARLGATCAGDRRRLIGWMDVLFEMVRLQDALFDARALAVAREMCDLSFKVGVYCIFAPPSSLCSFLPLFFSASLYYSVPACFVLTDTTLQVANRAAEGDTLFLYKSTKIILWLAARSTSVREMLAEDNRMKDIARMKKRFHVNRQKRRDRKNAEEDTK